MAIAPVDVALDANIEGHLIGSPVSIIREFTSTPVSYTHLTLPTSDLV